MDSFQNIGGISQPVIGQRKIDHEVRLKEGEANLLGGMLEDSQTRSLSGIPGLAQIPILKYLFGQTNTERRQTETVFVLIPHIVRGLVISDLNQRGIDVGTANSIELRQMSHASSPETSAAAQGPPRLPRLKRWRLQCRSLPLSRRLLSRPVQASHLIRLRSRNTRVLLSR